MKNLFLLLAVCFLATVSYGQLKVVATGEVQALNQSFVVGGAATGTAGISVDLGRDRAGSGAAQIRIFDDASGVVKFNFQRLSNGASILRHVGTNIFGFTASNAADMVWRTNNLVRMRLTAAGALNITGGATVNGGMAVTSDKRLKSNINTLEYGLNEVMQLNPVSYAYTGEANTPTGRNYVGLVAQELQKVMPEFVSINKFVDYADNGDIVIEKDYLQIHDSELKYVLLKAIQDQQVLIEEQAEKISSLETAFEGLGSIDANHNTNVTLSAYDLAQLEQNVPNPFNATTTISYIVPTEANTAIINIYGQNGQLMKTVDIEHVGVGTLNVDASDLPSGTYTYQLVVDDRNIQSNKMVVTK